MVIPQPFSIYLVEASGALTHSKLIEVLLLATFQIKHFYFPSGYEAGACIDVVLAVI